MEEIFLPVVGYENKYAISNFGRLYSYPRKGTKGGFYKSKGEGYDYVSLGKAGTTIHRLVYETFIGKIPKGMEVNHIDENKKNNCIWNLNLMTRKENANYCTGSKRAGEKHKIRIYQYTKDGKFIKEWNSLTEAAENYCVKKCTLWGALKGYNGAKTCKGFIWKYKNNGDSIESPIL